MRMDRCSRLVRCLVIGAGLANVMVAPPSLPRATASRVSARRRRTGRAASLA